MARVSLSRRSRAMVALAAVNLLLLGASGLRAEQTPPNNGTCDTCIAHGTEFNCCVIGGCGGVGQPVCKCIQESDCGKVN